MRFVSYSVTFPLLSSDLPGPAADRLHRGYGTEENKGQGVDGLRSDGLVSGEEVSVISFHFVVSGPLFNICYRYMFVLFL